MRLVAHFAMPVQQHCCSSQRRAMREENLNSRNVNYACHVNKNDQKLGSR